VTRTQLLDAGLSARQIHGHVGKGRLIAVHRGVYRVGHAAPSVLATYMAAVLACGPGSLLAGRAAAHLYRLTKGSPPPPEVLSPTQRKVPGVRNTRCRRLDPGDGTVFRRIPVTTVPRTIVDLAAVLPEHQLALAVHEASVRFDLTPHHVQAVGSVGAEKLRRVLHGDVRVTLSTLERRFLHLLREAGLPLPQTNRPAGGRLVDCRWPAHRLTVELDGYRYHRSRHAWEQDRRREREAYARGDSLRRYTYADVVEHPRLLLRELRGLLAAG
jgi:very-short-patch-repair endonuclease